MKRKLFNKNDRYDLHKLGGFMNAGFQVQYADALDSEDVLFCRHVMYWHDHYASKGWTLPTWAQMPDFQGWLNSFRSSYHSAQFMRDAMEPMVTRYFSEAEEDRLADEADQRENTDFYR
jgi:hypothetical protein